MLELARFIVMVRWLVGLFAGSAALAVAMAPVAAGIMPRLIFATVSTLAMIAVVFACLAGER